MNISLPGMWAICSAGFSSQFCEGDGKISLPLTRCRVIIPCRVPVCSLPTPRLYLGSPKWPHRWLARTHLGCQWLDTLVWQRRHGTHIPVCVWGRRPQTFLSWLMEDEGKTRAETKRVKSERCSPPRTFRFLLKKRDQYAASSNIP